MLQRAKGQGIRNKEAMEEREGEKEKEEGQGCLLWRDKGLLLGREESDVAHSLMAVYKEKDLCGFFSPAFPVIEGFGCDDWIC